MISLDDITDEINEYETKLANSSNALDLCVCSLAVFIWKKLKLEATVVIPENNTITDHTFIVCRDRVHTIVHSSHYIYRQERMMTDAVDIVNCLLLDIDSMNTFKSHKWLFKIGTVL
jgi:hypothetical protein